MAYSEELAERMRRILPENGKVSEVKMFGGLSFLWSGNMCCGVIGDEIVIRVGLDGHAEALTLPHARPRDFTGRAKKGFVYVDAEGTKSEADLETWVHRGIDFASTLPKK